MFKVAFDNKDKTDKTIYIKHSYSVKGVKKQMIIEKYPSANALDAKYGSWESFIEERIKFLTEEKKTQDNARDVFQFVPLQDFTSNSDIDWSRSIGEIDAQLYEKYGLERDGIDFIERMIKPME